MTTFEEAFAICAPYWSLPVVGHNDPFHVWLGNVRALAAQVGITADEVADAYPSDPYETRKMIHGYGGIGEPLTSYNLIPPLIEVDLGALLHAFPDYEGNVIEIAPHLEQQIRLWAQLRPAIEALPIRP